MNKALFRAAFGACVGASLAACGGGVEEDNGASSAALVCATTCVDSSTVDASQIRHSYALVSDGQQMQAQAGFSTGSDPRFNVEIKGGDQLELATPQGVQGFHIPSQSLGEAFANVFTTLATGASPYLSEVVPMPSAASDYQFRFSRNGKTMSATVTMPAPFTIVAPAADSTLNVAAATATARISGQGNYGFTADFSCVDVNGNTASMSNVTIAPLAPPQTDTGGSTYTLQIGLALNGLQFTTAHPRGAVSSCDVKLHVGVENDGTPSPDFAAGSRIFAQQWRDTSFKLAATP
jgi:hypothetical protein